MFFFGKPLRLCPWSLALASSIPVLGLERVCPRKGCPWPWPWIFFVFLPLASSLVSSTPPLVIIFDWFGVITSFLIQLFPSYLASNKTDYNLFIRNSDVLMRQPNPQRPIYSRSKVYCCLGYLPRCRGIELRWHRRCYACPSRRS